MAIPINFQFSQSNLQDFVTCPRRFELRYLWQLSWPAVESEPIREAERLSRMGREFHRLVQQHHSGLDETVLTESLIEAEPELRAWWERYLVHRPAGLAEAQTLPELTLSTPLRGYRLTARFDLLARWPDGRISIIDWKTTQHKPAREKLAGQIQTRVYPYVLVAAGAALNGGQPLDPGQVTMIYWYPAAPEQPEVFKYNQALFERDERFLSDLIEQVKQTAETGDFPLTEVTKPCDHCVYRSFCDRGRRAGPLAELEIEPAVADFTLPEWDQIAEIQF